MSLSNILTPFQYAFYVLGQSPFPSATFASTNNFRRFFFKLPVLVLLCVSVYVTILLFRNDYYITCVNRGLDIIHFLLIMSSLITNLVITYQCIFQDQFWTQLQDMLFKLETEFEDLLPNKNVKFTKFRNVFVIKCVTMLISYFILILAMIMSRITNESVHTTYMVVLAFINDLCAFHVVFYVDLIKKFLKTITDAFQDISEDHDEIKCLNAVFIDTKFIMSMKKLHSSIHKTVAKVNEFFGLFLLSYIVQQFLVISYYIFWIFLNKFNVGPWSSLG